MKLAKYISKEFLQLEEDTELSLAIKKLRENRAFDCIVTKNGKYVGMFSLIKILDKKLVKGMKIKDLIIKPTTLSSSSDEQDAINAILDEVSSIPLLDRDAAVAVVPYSSLLRLLYSQKVFDNIYVENVIEKNNPNLYLSESVEDALEVAKKIKHFTYPVVDLHGKLFSAVKIYEIVDYAILRPNGLAVSNITTNDFISFSESSSLKVIVEKLINNLDDVIIVNSEHVPIGTLNIFELFKKAISNESQGAIKIIFSGEKDYSFYMYFNSEIKRKEHFLIKVGKIKEIRVNIKKLHNEKYEIDLNLIRENNEILSIKGEGFRKDSIMNDILERLENIIVKGKE
ncbi:MAG: CBS domain-containing protein [Candidatus Parvarchaeota archaeon]|nr:CBS domain-containing protein [Candidatus Rehaiarchaeum fermentans]MCW1293527.1 CBS domain-containing protein [Candidatus Rehaiarchaeum fermentans]